MEPHLTGASADGCAQQLSVALLNLQAGMLPQALSLLGGVLAIEPDNARALEAQAQASLQVRDFTGALRAALKLATLQPHSAHAHLLAGRCHKALGQIADAIRCYRESLRVQPDQAEVEVSLGIALRASGDVEGAGRAYRRALRLDDRLAIAHHNLANLLLAGGETAQARQSYERALALNPRLGDAHFELGNLALLRGEQGEAGAHFRAAVDCGLYNPRAALTAGKTLYGLRERGVAHRAFAQACSLAPEDQEALFLHGRSLYEQHDFERAIQVHGRAVQLRPDFADAYVNLAASLRGGGRHREAAQCYEKALSLDSKLPAAQLGLAMLDWDFHRNDEAHDRLLLLVESVPDYPDAWLMLTVVSRELTLYGDALRASARALELDPGSAQAHSNEATIRLQMGDAVRAMAAFERSMALGPEWKEGAQVAVTLWNYAEENDPAAVLRAHRDFGERFFPRPPTVLPARAHRDRLRVGYLSPDMFSHSVSYFLEPLLANHDKSRVEVYCYHLGRVTDDTTARIQGYADHWRHCLEWSDGELHRRLLEDELDVLVDCAGHTRGSRVRVLGARCAPAQVLWLGYPTTSGLPAMDFRITDPVVDPAGYDLHSTERLLRLPHSYYCYQPPVDAPPVSALPAASEAGIVFGSFNNLPKLSDATVALWCDVLAAVPGSRLMIKSGQLADEPVADATLARFADRGVDPARIRLHGRVKQVSSHLELYGAIDIALDTFPYNGATTSCEALWMGVPVVTLCGPTHAARMAASILGAAGCSQWVTHDKQAYVAACVALAGDLTALAATRAALRQRLRASALMDATRFAAQFESALEQARQATAASAA